MFERAPADGASGLSGGLGLAVRISIAAHGEQ